MRVVVAIEPRSYSQAIGQTIQALRSHLEVVIVEPGALRSVVESLVPELVICSQPKGAPSGSMGVSWIDFRPYDTPPANVCVSDQRWTLKEVGLEDFLSIVDRTEELLQPSARTSAFSMA